MRSVRVHFTTTAVRFNGWTRMLVGTLLHTGHTEETKEGTKERKRARERKKERNREENTLKTLLINTFRLSTTHITTKKHLLHSHTETERDRERERARERERERE